MVRPHHARPPDRFACQSPPVPPRARGVLHGDTGAWVMDGLAAAMIAVLKAREPSCPQADGDAPAAVCFPMGTPPRAHWHGHECRDEIAVAAVHDRRPRRAVPPRPVRAPPLGSPGKRGAAARSTRGQGTHLGNAGGHQHDSAACRKADPCRKPAVLGDRAHWERGKLRVPRWTGCNALHGYPSSRPKRMQDRRAAAPAPALMISSRSESRRRRAWAGV